MSATNALPSGFLSLPPNPPKQMVSRRRPITFYVVTPLLSVFWIVVSLIWTVLKLPIPRCWLCETEPRTRPRPPKAREAPEQSPKRFNAFTSLKAGSRSLFGLTARRAPRRVLSPKAARTPGYHPHDLDNVDESDEDALEREGQQEMEEDGPGHLTPDDGESDTEPSEVDTLVDSLEACAPKNRKQGKERRFFSRKPRRGTSTDDDSPTDVGSGSGSSTAVSGNSNSSTPPSSIIARSTSKFCPMQKGLRRAKSSNASPTRPPLLFTHSDPYPHHLTADPESYHDDDRPSFTRSSTSSSSELSPSSPVDSAQSGFSAASTTLASQQTPRKKPCATAASFLKHPFRSRSPLATSPNHSPPLSPKLEAQKGRRRSIDELRVDTLNLRIGRARARSELDDSGNSGLSMHDVLGH